jgi:NAD(P)H-hydrate epimerase
MILSLSEIQDAEKRAAASGVSAEMLMEEAGRQMAAAVRQFLPFPGKCLAFFGKGHNGGDALVCGRLLSQVGWNVTLVPSFEKENWAPLTLKKWSEAGLCQTETSLETLEKLASQEKGPLLILDGILGIGASGQLRPPVLERCRAINRFRTHLGARVAALDLPTGLDGDTGSADAGTVTADWTLTVCFVKAGLLANRAERHVGRLVVISLPELLRFAPLQSKAQPQISSSQNLASLIPRRTANTHKGKCGRIILVAGNVGTLGAACLGARGALRAGAGLVTLCVPENIYPLVAARAPDECMVRPFSKAAEALALRSDSLGIGPGLGTDEQLAGEIQQLIKYYPSPAVLDADALNILGSDPDILRQCEGPRLITPHAGEMARLFPEFSGENRFGTVENFTRKYPVTLLLKGARTLIGENGQVRAVNTTGNPGMASGGMGDVLTGVCTSLLARGLSPLQSAQVAAWICGRSAEMVVAQNIRNEESLLASDVADHLGLAIESLRRGAY